MSATRPTAGAALVLQHQTQDHAAYLRTWLEREALPHTIVNAEAGQAYPRSIDGWRALAVLGGEHGANDDLPALRDALRLIEQSFERGVPVLGHCLGSQLMARVLGARVVGSPQPEIGWHPVDWLDVAARHDWFGTAPPRRVFQWHYDMFELPASAVALARSDACPAQAFAFGVKHLAMQFHVEVDAVKLRSWAAAVDQRCERARQRHSATIQSAQAWQALSGEHLAPQQALAERVYRRWLGL